MVDWDQWQTALAVFRQGTYAGAARSLGVDATTVGRRLKLLEKRIGHALFLRRDNRLYPTRSCESLLSHIEVAAEALRNAEQQTPMTDSGAVWRELRMTAPPFLVTNLFAPAVGRLTRAHHIRVELMATASNASLTRREADLALRIEDRPLEPSSANEQIEGTRIGGLRYAVYCESSAEPERLPWAGLMGQHLRTTGREAMMELAGTSGFQYQAYHFETLREYCAAGVARAMLPRFMADTDPRLACISDTVIEQPLWMLYHRQDRDVLHLEAARSWVQTLAGERL